MIDTKGFVTGMLSGFMLGIVVGFVGLMFLVI
jgi:hypothetical protein